jgi:hypothetical protein
MALLQLCAATAMPLHERPRKPRRFARSPQSTWRNDRSRFGQMPGRNRLPVLGRRKSIPLGPGRPIECSSRPANELGLESSTVELTRDTLRIFGQNTGGQPIKVLTATKSESICALMA